MSTMQFTYCLMLTATLILLDYGTASNSDFFRFGVGSRPEWVLSPSKPPGAGGNVDKTVRESVSDENTSTP